MKSRNHCCFILCYKILHLVPEAKSSIKTLVNVKALNEAATQRPWGVCGFLKFHVIPINHSKVVLFVIFQKLLVKLIRFMKCQNMSPLILMFKQYES